MRFLVKNAALGLLVLLLVFALACKKKKPLPPDAQTTSTATTEGAAMNKLDSGLVPVPMSPVTVVPTGAATATATIAVITPGSLPDSMGAADRAAFVQTKDLITNLEPLVKKGLLTNPDKPDEPDATTKCTANEEARHKLALATDPEAKKVAADAQRLCSLDVPVVSADKALKQLAGSSSQASHLLMCGLAQKDLDKARAAQPRTGDRRVRDLEGRFARSCR